MLTPLSSSLLSIYISTVQIEPPPKTATELLEEEAAAAAASGPSDSAPDFAPQPAGSNNPFGASAFGGAGGAFAQVSH